MSDESIAIKIDIASLEKQIVKEINHALSRLRSAGLPEPLARMVSKGAKKFDYCSASAAMLFVPNSIRRLFSVLGNIDAQTGYMVRAAEASIAMKKPADFERLVLGDLVHNRDDFDLIGAYEHNGSGFRRLYSLLVDISRSAHLSDDQRRAVVRKIGIFEEGGLEILLDEASYNLKTKNGNEGTLSEYVGYMVQSALFSEESPHVRSGRYVESVKGAIRVKDILTGKINEDNKNVLRHQEGLLQLLHTVSRYCDEKRIPASYWASIAANPNFLRTAYIILREEKDASTDQMLASLIKQTHEEVKGDITKLEDSMESFVQMHFRDDAYKRFLDDPKNRYNQLFPLGICGDLGDKVPRTNRFLAGPHIIVMTGYFKQSSGVRVTYADVTDKVEHREILFDKARKCDDCSDVGTALREMLASYESFVSAYNKVAALKRKKS